MSENQLTVIETKLKTDVAPLMAAQLGRSVTDPEIVRYISGALMVIKDDWKIQKCDAKSICDALIQIWRAKLPFDGRKLAYLIPYDNKTGSKVQLEIDYKGYVHVICTVDPNAIVLSNLVFNDEYPDFKIVTQGLDEHAFYTRKPRDIEEDWANVHGCYVELFYKGHSSVTYLTRKQVLAAREKSKTGDFYIDRKTGKKVLSVWGAFTEDMIKKVVVRKACKLKKIDALAELDRIDNLNYDMSKRIVVETEPINYAKEVPMPNVIDVPEIKPTVPVEQKIEKPATEPIKEPKKTVTKPKAVKPKAVKDERIDELQGDIQTMQGYIEKFVERKGKGPWKIILEGGWYSTFNEVVAKQARELEACEVSITYTTEITNKNGTEYDNSMIESIREIEMANAEAPEEENSISDDVPFDDNDSAEIAGEMF